MILWLVFYFMLGAVAGSFLACCASRFLHGGSIVYGRSVCESCGHRLNAIDLVPVFSYLYLRGRCRYCNETYSVNSLAAEIITGTAFVLCGIHTMPGLSLVLMFTFTGCLILISLIDYEKQIIPDYLVCVIAVNGILYNLLHHPDMIFDAILGGVLGFAIMLAVFIISRGGMGGGDVKLSAAAGLWLGVEGTLLFLLLSFAFDGIISIVLLASGIKNKGDAVPFGPFLCISAFIVLLYKPNLLNYYWNLF